MTTHPQTIVELQSSNVKRLTAVKIDAAGKPVVVIGGRNGQGKSSVLDSIVMAFAGKDALPDEPIRSGEHRAVITCKTQDYTIERRITPSGSTLTVTENGAKLASPQAFLDKLTNDIAFDPLSFLRLKPKEQSKVLQKLIGVDVDALATQRQAIYNERAQANAAVKALEARVQPLHPDVPDTVQNVADMAERVRDAERHSAAVKEARCNVDYKRLEVERLTRLLAEAKAAHADAIKRVESMAPPENIDGLLAAMRQVEATNKKVRENTEQRGLAKQLDAARAKATALQRDLDAFDASARDRLAAASMPVPGLTVDADMVRWNGVPIAQASQAEQIRLGVAIALAQRPGLRVALVRDGSLLDDDSMAALAQAAAAHGAQVWVERVGRGKEVSVVIEDGAVHATQDGGVDPLPLPEGVALDDNPFPVA